MIVHAQKQYRLCEGWLIERSLGLLGHSCHGRRTVFFFRPNPGRYGCPACKTALPEHIEFIAQCVLAKGDDE